MCDMVQGLFFWRFRIVAIVSKNFKKFLEKSVDIEKWLWYSNLAVAREQKNIDN